MYKNKDKDEKRVKKSATTPQEPVDEEKVDESEDEEVEVVDEEGNVPDEVKKMTESIADEKFNELVAKYQQDEKIKIEKEADEIAQKKFRDWQVNHQGVNMKNAFAGAGTNGETPRTNKQYSSYRTTDPTEELVRKMVTATKLKPEIFVPSRDMYFIGTKNKLTDYDKAMVTSMGLYVQKKYQVLTDPSMRAFEELERITKGLSMTDAFPDGAGTGTPTTDTGEQVVPPGWLNILEKARTRKHIITDLVQTVPAIADTGTFPSYVSGVTTYFVGELEHYPDSTPVFTQGTWSMAKLVSKVPWSAEYAMSAPSYTGLFVAKLMKESMDLKEWNSFMEGDPTKGEYYGLLKAKISTYYLAKGVPYTADDLFDLKMSVPEAYRDTGRFFIHTDELKTIMKMKNSKTDEYIYSAPTSGDEPTIWGRPFTVHDKLPTTGVTTQIKQIIYGDPMDIWLWTREALQTQVSDNSTFMIGKDRIDGWDQDVIVIKAKKRAFLAPIRLDGFATLQGSKT